MNLRIVFSTIIVFFFSINLHAAEMYGLFMVVKGDIKVTSGKTKATQAAKIGMKVFESDTISSGADSRGKIVMSDRNVININPDTEFTIKKYVNDPSSNKKEVQIDLSKGKLRTNVEQKYDGENNKFEIKTPSAVAGVRGTRFLMNFDNKTGISQVFTFHGAVSVASITAAGLTPPVIVKMGQSSSIQSGKAPDAPVEIPKDVMKKMDRESQADTVKAPSAPSSMTMVDKQDLAEGKRAVEKRDDRPTGPPPPPPTPPPPPPQIQPVSDIIKDVITTTNGKTKVIVVPVPQ